MNALHDTAPLMVRMSGSGGTCFAIYGSDNEAEVAAVTIKKNHADWFVVATNSVMEGN
jgi:4-diphosphocytidyl-2-C-methyl-D-erythritol kinase